MLDGYALEYRTYRPRDYRSTLPLNQTLYEYCTRTRNIVGHLVRPVVASFDTVIDGSLLPTSAAHVLPAHYLYSTTDGMMR